MRASLLILSLFPLSLLAAKLNYEVSIVGLQDPVALKALENSSDLIALHDRPPASINGLRYRARGDIPKLLKILKAYAYYDADISYEIEYDDEQRLIVYLFVQPGPQYQLASYEIFHGDCKDPLVIERCTEICPETLGLSLGQSADSISIVNAEVVLLNELARCGYPLAYIDKRRIIVDMATKEVDAAVCVQEGPLTRFGPITFFGLKTVKPRFIERKIAWKEGEVFNLDLVDETQRRLLKSDLFGSVLITHSEELDEAGEMSMKIRLAEAKHKTVSIGAFYATVDGPGGSFSWENRNVRGMGEKLSIDLEGSKRFIAGTLIYKKSDFLAFDQSFSMLGEASRENIHSYLAFTYRQSNMIERNVDSKRSFSVGLKGEYIVVQKSANDGHFFVMGLPVTGKYTTADSPIDPTTGWSLTYIATPYQSLQEGTVHYVKQRLIGNFYFPFTKEKKVVLALHALIGSIAGARQKEIPLPKLFLGGSEDDLRGYAYKTVSPLVPKSEKVGGISVPVKHGGKPLGGRSAIFTSVELRLRITQTIGVVPFADFGTVTLDEWPQVDAKWYKSVGVGLRYFTFFGPLRFDAGFPLDRRKGLDSWIKIYASIGQSF